MRNKYIRRNGSFYATSRRRATTEAIVLQRVYNELLRAYMHIGGGGGGGEDEKLSPPLRSINFERG